MGKGPDGMLLLEFSALFQPIQPTIHSIKPPTHDKAKRELDLDERKPAT